MYLFTEIISLKITNTVLRIFFCLSKKKRMIYEDVDRILNQKAVTKQNEIGDVVTCSPK